MNIHDFERILICAAGADISDIYISVNQPIAWKRYGDVNQLNDYVPSIHDLWEFFTHVATDEVREEYIDGKDVTFPYDLDGWRYRFTAYRTKETLSFVIRTIRVLSSDFSQLGDASIIENHLEGHGLVIVAGDNGSGRTTTINTALKYLIDNKDVHITTLQNVLMFDYTKDKATIHHRGYNTCFYDWNKAIETATLDGSDVIYISDYSPSMADAIIKLAKRRLVLLKVDGVSFTDIKEALSNYDSKLQKRFEAVIRFSMIQSFESNPDGGMVIRCKTMPPTTK